MMNAESNRFRIILSFLLLIIGVCAQVIPGAAQAETILAVEPNTVSVPLGNQVQVALEVSNGVNVNEFDLMINYDSVRLSLASWEYGSFFSGLTCTRMINQPGLFELACEQVGKSAVNGDGVLLTMTFNTLALGTPDVTITEAIFADPNGSLSYPARQGGIVEVTNAPTYTPTPTITNTPTITRTMTGSPAPTITPTSTFTNTPTLTPTITLTSTPVPSQTATPSPEPSLSATETYVSMSTDMPQAEVSLPPTSLAPVETSPEVTPNPELPQDTVEVIDDEEGASQTTSLLRRLWCNVLWGVLILGGIGILWMIIHLIWRLRQKKKDNLML